MSARKLTVLAATLASVASLAGRCYSSTAPSAGGPVLDVVNFIDQAGPDSTAAEADSVVFTVSLSPGTTPSEMAQIASMDVVWPGGSPVTPLDTSFQATIAGWFASTGLAHAGGLTTGTYTLEIHFADGSRKTADAEYAGAIQRPTIQNLTVGSNLLTLSWQAPAQPHYYRLALTQGGDTITTSGEQVYTVGGVDLTESMVYAHGQSTSYDLILLLSDPTNVRVVHIPFDYPAP